MRKIILALLITFMAATLAAADTLYLRDGRTVQGTVLGYINGRFAVKLSAPYTTQATGQNSTSRTSQPGEIVFIRPRDVERVEIDNRSLEEARYLTQSVQVELGPNWVDTGVDLRRNERVQITATGTILAGRTRITPGGLRSRDPNAPMPSAAEGVLIGAVGNDPNSPIIEIGLNREFVADRDGRLYLTANRSTYEDARGAFTAQIRREINFGQRSTAGNRRNNNDDDDAYDLDPFGTGRNDPGPVRPRVLGSGRTVGGPLDRTGIERTVDVPGNSRGTDTGIDLRSGDSVTINATGTITAGQRAGVVSPDGGRASITGSLLGTRPVPSAGVGALIGFIRTASGQMSQPFLVGSRQTFTTPSDGRLFLLVNDDNYGDNSGSFSALISVAPGSSGGYGTPTGGAGAERNVTVNAAVSNVDTGVDVRRGDQLSFSATGMIYSRGTVGIGPEGNPRYDSFGRLPADAPFGSLVGYIRMADGRATPPFQIGAQRTVSAPADGRLFLMVNDNDYQDNSGSFRVRIVY